MTTKKTAMRVKFDLIKPVDPTDFESIGTIAKDIDAAREFLTKRGFTFASETTARLGSHNFGDDKADDLPD